MLQTISHDLRNPISAVLLMTGMLAADATGSQPLTTEVRSALIAKVELSVQRMDRLLTDLLDSDPMRGPADRHVSCDVGELVRRVLAGLDIAQEHPVETDIRSVSAGRRSGPRGTDRRESVGECSQPCGPGSTDLGQDRTARRRCADHGGRCRGRHPGRLGRNAFSSRSGAAPMRARTGWVWVCGSCLASPSCTAAGPGSTSAPAAAHRFGCTSPHTGSPREGRKPFLWANPEPDGRVRFNHDLPERVRCRRVCGPLELGYQAEAGRSDRVAAGPVRRHRPSRIGRRAGRCHRRGLRRWRSCARGPAPPRGRG